MDTRDRERLETDIRELEALMARGKGSRDPETRWVICLLSRCLDSRRKQLREAAQER